jgi:hypothetical protein
LVVKRRSEFLILNGTKGPHEGSQTDIPHAVSLHFLNMEGPVIKHAVVGGPFLKPKDLGFELIEKCDCERFDVPKEPARKLGVAVERPNERNGEFLQTVL